jgi:SH3-like domain-containing protein
MRQLFVQTKPYFRRQLLVVAAGVSFFCAPVAGDEFSPYRARVAVVSAPVRSGPGQNFYATDTLGEGDAVEVYRQRADGWCAIRPPEGSFSWVFARHVRMQEGLAKEGKPRYAEIDKPDVASRIGSRLSEQRNAVQVRLKKGEVVELIGEEQAGSETWYKIAPPAGEFRWIHENHIRRTGPIASELNQSAVPSAESANPSSAAELGDLNEPQTNESIITTAIPSDESAIQTVAVEEPAAQASPSTTSTEQNETDWRAAPQESTESLAPPPLAPVAAGAESTDANQIVTNKDITPVSADAPKTATSAVPVGSSVGRSLTQLELRLSRMVSDPTVAWQIEPLRAEAQSLLGQAQSAAERTAIQQTVAKLDRFATIAQRYRALAASSPGATPGASPYDAVGTLRPVKSRRPGAPPFALLDDRGQVVSFVSPAAGVNLQPLIGQRIGVTGSRGYIPEFQRTHIAAGHAAPLTGSITR